MLSGVSAVGRYRLFCSFLVHPGNGQADISVKFGTAGYYRIKATGPDGSAGWVTADVGVNPNTAPLPAGRRRYRARLRHSAPATGYRRSPCRT